MNNVRRAQNDEVPNLIKISNWGGHSVTSLDSVLYIIS